MHRVLGGQSKIGGAHRVSIATKPTPMTFAESIWYISALDV